MFAKFANFANFANFAKFANLNPPQVSPEPNSGYPL